MKNNIIKKALMFLALMVFILPLTASAHRSGCHRWHSCPSDTGSYVCGDLGYTSGCPTTSASDSSYQNYQPTTSTASNSSFVGIPKTRADLNNCLVVGNYSSYIYHLKGSKYIKGMVLKSKKCFTSEQEAIDAGFRKAKASTTTKTKSVITPSTNPAPKTAVIKQVNPSSDSAPIKMTKVEDTGKYEESPELTNYRNQIILTYINEIARFKKTHDIKQMLKTASEYSISDIEDKITIGEGFKIGNPNSAEGVDYIATLFNIQLDFKRKELNNLTSVIKWLQDAQIEMKNSLSVLKNLNTKEQLDKQIENIKTYEDNLDKAQKTINEWSDADHKLQIRTDAIIAGLSSVSSSAKQTPVTPTYQPVFIPSPSPYKLNCTSTKNFLGEIETKCY
ncbi:hypothetical protein H0W91_03300 [Patescibacteria group bacterium]|nr:hypothetical protein [Patescibacteria group bacterium]